MKQHFLNWSIKKKITAVFIFLVLLPAILFGTYIIHKDIEHKIEIKKSNLQLVLQLMAEDINAKSSRVEYLIGLLATSRPVIQILGTEMPYGEYASYLNYEVQAELNSTIAYLSELSASVLLISERELPEKYDTLMNRGSFLPDAELDNVFSVASSFWGMPGWHMPAGLLTSSYYTKEGIPYYRAVKKGLYSVVGVVKCSVPLERLFQILDTKEVSQPIYVMCDEQVVYSTFNGPYSAEAETVTVPILSIGMSLVTGVPALRTREVLQEGLFPVVLLLLFAAVLVFIARIILKRTLVGFNEINQAVEKLNNGGYGAYRLPEHGGDEIGRLFTEFNRLLDSYQAQTQILIDQERNMHKAELLALQCQINPHFLFNSLNWLQLSIENHQYNDEMSDAIAHLGNVLRYNMSSSYLSTVRDELKSIHECKAFLDARDFGKVIITYDCPAELEDEPFLRFALQPLVENSIRHGKRDGVSLHVTITFRLRDDMIVLSVSNDGLPVSSERLAQINEALSTNRPVRAEGVGLYNLIRRLYLLHSKVEVEMLNQDECVILQICVDRLSNTETHS